MRQKIVRLACTGAVAAGLFWTAGRIEADEVAAQTVVGKECAMNRLEQSACVIEAILTDLRTTYRLAGAISGIRQISETSFTARVSREEKVDEFTYEFAFAEDGAVSIVSKVEE